MKVQFYILLMMIVFLNLIWSYKHFLIFLLNLEFLVLFFFLIMFFYLNLFSYENYFSMIFLSMSVCESALGLSLLVLMMRSYGSDYFLMMNLLW